MSFVVLPLLVTAVTPFKYRDLLSIPRDTLITIFAAAKIIVVLPQLVENIKELFRRYDLEDEEVSHGAEPLLRGNTEWSGFISTWVEMNTKNGLVDKLFQHWIGGGGAKPKEPRWSVIRDVLHWVD